MKHKANTIRYNISYKVKSKSRKYNIEEKKKDFPQKEIKCIVNTMYISEQKLMHGIVIKQKKYI